MRAAERCSNYKSNFYVSYGDKEAYPPVPVHNGYFCRHDEKNDNGSAGVGTLHDGKEPTAEMA